MGQVTKASKGNESDQRNLSGPDARESGEGMTNIQWTDETWNPVTGCEKIAPGCKNCYADAEHKRRHKAYLAHGGVYPKTGKPMPKQYAKPFESVQLHPDRLDAPPRMRRGRRIFVCSGADLFHDDVPFEFIAAVFGVMAACPQHTFQVLTKRPERALEFFEWVAANKPSQWDEPKVCVDAMAAAGVDTDWFTHPAWPLPNVEFGVSLSDQPTADKNIPILLRIPAAVRFVSAEPLLGPVDLWTPCSKQCPQCHGAKESQNSVEGGIWVSCPCERLVGLKWVIVGGESGPGARPCDVAWIRSIVQQCKAASVPVFMKQLGSKPTGAWTDDAKLIVDPAKYWGERIKDKKGGDPSEWPADLRVREFPMEAQDA